MRTIFLIIFILFNHQVFSAPPYTGLVCTDDKNLKKLEFFFVQKETNYIRVFKRVSNNFIDVGQIVGQKPGSFSLWEDKNMFLGTDFAWHLDKVTGILSPFILSQSMKKIKNLPPTLNCRSESFWY